MSTNVRVGVDLVDIKRFDKILKRHGDRLLEKVFAEDEIRFIKEKNFSTHSIAARFAAKEAFMKLVGEGIYRIPFREIAIMTKKSGRPHYLLKGKARELYETLEICSIDLSITHEKSFAIAFATAILR